MTDITINIKCGGINHENWYYRATGKVGNKVLTEAQARGHEVTAIVRNASKLNDQDVKVIEKDIFSLTVDDIEDLDVVVNAFGAPLGEEEAHVEAGRALIKLLKEVDTRVIVVGGAGSLFVDEAHTTRVETPDFPDMFKPTAKGQGRNLQDLQDSEALLGHLLVHQQSSMQKVNVQVLIH